MMFSRRAQTGRASKHARSQASTSQASTLHASGSLASADADSVQPDPSAQDMDMHVSRPQFARTLSPEVCITSQIDAFGMDSDPVTVQPVAVDTHSEPARQAVLPEEPARRRRTQHRVPAKFRDLAPEPLPPVETVAARVQRVVEHVVERVFEPVKTAANAFGLFRVFRAEPAPVPTNPPLATPAKAASWYPYPNRSSALFNNWFWNDGTTKSCDSRSSLLDILLQPGFSLDELRGINWTALDDILASDLGNFGDGWIHDSISIDVPGGRGIEARPVEISGFQHRPLVPLLEHILATDPTVETHWNWTPSALMHRDASGVESRTAGEVFHSRRAERLYNQVQDLPREPDDTLERRVIYLMPGSDATHLAQFGTASAWPGLMGIGNQSNYVRTRRDAHAMHHFASFPKVFLMPSCSLPILTLP